MFIINRCRITYPFLISFFLVFSHWGYSQGAVVSEESLSANIDYSIKIWNSENGLTQKHIFDLIQTDNGFIWLISYHNLTRFDGISFRNYNATTTNGFPEEPIRFLFEDPEKTLWIVSGKAFYKFSGDSLIHYHPPSEDQQFVAMCKDGKEIYINTDKGKIYRVQNGFFSLYADVGGFYITKMLFANHKLYLGTKDGLFSLTKDRLLLFEGLKNKEITGIKKGPDGAIYITDLTKLHTLKNGSLSELKIPCVLTKERPGDYFRDFMFDQDKIWLATKSGVIVVQGEKCSYISAKNGLTANEISTMLKDAEGNIWLVSPSAGINKLKLKVIKSYSETENYYGGSSGSIIKIGKTLLIGNYCAGVFKFNDGYFSKLLSRGCTWSLLNDKDDNLWVGTYGGGIDRYDKGKFIKNYKEQDGIPSNIVFALFLDNKNILWAGTSKGICRFENNTFVPLKPQISSAVTHFMQDKRGDIWFCSQNGLGHIENGGIQLYTTAEGLPSNHVRYIYQDSDDTYWITTYGGGIARLKNGVLFSFNKNKGLWIDNYVSAIAEDDRHRFWVSTNEGIYAIYKEDLNDFVDGKSSSIPFVYHGRESGMKNTECNGGFQSPVLKTENGGFYFSTINGIVFVDPSKANTYDYSPKIFIEKIVSDRKEIPVTDSVIQISEETSQLEIYFNAPYFGDANNLIVQYKLEGLNDQWNYQKDRRVITYNKLLPGDYVFRLKISDKHNKVFNKEKRLKFTIPTPFYKRWSFIYTALFTLIITGALIIFSVVYIIKRSEAKKTTISKNYALLELKTLQSQMNPHFIFNCLNTINYFIITSDKKAAGRYLVKFSTLVRMFLMNSKSNYIFLSVEIELLELYIELEQLRIDHQFEVNMEIDELLEKNKIKIPGMLFQPFVENAIHHGLRNSNREKILNITFKKEGNSLVGIIDDNGIGRKESAEKKIGLGNKHVSMGILSIRERIETINYIENIDITLEITDKINSNKEPDGTLIKITIPLDKSFTF